MLPIVYGVNVSYETGMFKCLSVTEGNVALGPEVQFGVKLNYVVRHIPLFFKFFKIFFDTGVRDRDAKRPHHTRNKRAALP